MENLPVPLTPRQLDRVFRQPVPRYFSASEVEAILNANLQDVRTRILVDTLWRTGIRCSELISITKPDLDPYNRVLRVKTLKRGLKSKTHAGAGRKPQKLKTTRHEERILPLPGDLVAFMLAWLHSQDDPSEGRIFPFSRVAVFRIIRSACHTAGFTDERAHPHTFRHSYAVHLLTQGIPVTILKDLPGHSNISSTMVYLRITQSDVRAVFDQVRWH